MTGSMKGSETQMHQAIAAVSACEVVTLAVGADRPGIVAALTSVAASLGANIVSLDQYSDNPDGGAFFQRCVVRLAHCEDSAEFERQLKHQAKELGVHVELRDTSIPQRAAILVSKSDHCLLDLLWRQRRGEIPVTIPLVISNHTDTAEDVRTFGVPFVHVPSQGLDKSAAEAEILRLLVGNVDFVVLARYMQILSAGFIERLGVPVINIHHSFLPAFIGAGPYRKAKDRGVKLVGATAHYVTAELDEGPIIEQDVVRVGHADTAIDLQRRGADVERAVLSRAVLWHAQDRIIRHGNQTIVFP